MTAEPARRLKLIDFSQDNEYFVDRELFSFDSCDRNSVDLLLKN